jgi:A/G-specific adenine glycosylase
VAAARSLGLAAQLDALERFHGPAADPAPAGVFETILWESCAYLVDDARRIEVYARLEREVGLTPEAILAAAPSRLADVIAAGGMQPEHRSRKLLDAAALAAEAGGPRGMKKLIRESPQRARRLLRKFPGVGEPGADHLMVLAGALVAIAPESNGLRVLTRLGYGSAEGSYPTQYRSAAAAVRDQLPDDRVWLLRARALLRRHGQGTCRRAAPACEECPLKTGCRWFASRRRA